MSGETEGQPFGWTLDSLKVHLADQISHETDARVADVASIERVLDERDRRYEQRWVSQEDAVRLALVGVNKEMIERMRQVREETQAAMLASDKAITKAEDATEKRFEAVTRGAALLQEQAAQFSQRREVDAIYSSLSEKVFDIGSRLDSSAPRNELTQLGESLKTLIEAAASSSTTRYDSAISRLAALAEEIVVLKVSSARMVALEESNRSLKERLDKTEGHGAGGQAAWGWIAAAVSLIIGVIVIANLIASGR